MRRTFMLLLLIIFPVMLFSQEMIKSESWYDIQIDDAINNENYETAINLLRDAEEYFPEQKKYSIRLGDLFFNKGMYKLALDEYLTAESKDAEDIYTLDQIQLSYDYLNDYENCILYLNKLLELEPDAIYAIDDLSWMYYKTYRFEQGIELLIDALKQHGFRRGLAMKLGTLYFGLYDYEKSKQYYLEAIIDALLDTSSSYAAEFAAIGYYNLSLLEKRFYNFDLALEYTNESLKQMDRPTGHLAKGNLYESRMNFHRALEEYQNGYTKDKTPLTKINIAELYLEFGFIDYAESYALEVFEETDHSWIHLFGMDKREHFQELHELLSDIYSARSKRALYTPAADIIEKLLLYKDSLYYGSLSYYHELKYKLLTVIIALANIKEGNLLDAYWQLYLINSEYPDIALKYLNLGREIKTGLIPHSEAYYIMEEGKIRKAPELVLEALEQFDPYWEKDAVESGLLILTEIYEPNTEKYRNVLNRLYKINPGAFIQNGLGLPLEVDFDNAVCTFELIDLINQAGFDIRPAASVDEALEKGYNYKLIISNYGYTVLDLTLMKAVVQNDMETDYTNSELVKDIIENVYFVK